MTTYKRICIRDWEITDDFGNRFKVERGKEYITTEVGEAPSIGPEPVPGHVVVISDFWVPVPAEYSQAR
jgi:hypothetical protein